MRSIVSRAFRVRAVLALLALATLPVAAGADAVSDQKKAYHALGIDVSKHKAGQCGLLSRGEVARFVGKPVGEGTDAGPAVSGCQWHALDGSNDGLLVTRGRRGDWYPPTHDPQYTAVSGIGEKAYTSYEAGIGYEGAALNGKGVTGVQLSGKANAQAARDVLRLIVNR